MIGQKFGNLTVIAKHGSNKWGTIIWLCQCDCGDMTTARTNGLRRGDNKSCGCTRKSVEKKSGLTGGRSRGPNGQLLPVDLNGETIGDLSVIRPHGETSIGTTTWLCKCGKCGKKITGTPSKLRSQQTCRGDRHTTNGRSRYRSGFRIVLSDYREGAKERGIAWSLNDTQARSLFSGDCYYCGSPPTKERGSDKGIFLWNGIDRKDSKGDYIEDNCVSCCSKCNYMKGALPFDEFIELIKRIASHLQF